MKTSNLIILSTITLIFLTSIWILADAKSEFEKMLSADELNIETINLNNFSTIIAEEDAKVYLIKGDENLFLKYNNQDYNYRTSNDTLFIAGDVKMNIHFKTLINIVVKDNAYLNIEDYKSDYMNVSVKDEAQLHSRNIELGKLDLMCYNLSQTDFRDSNVDTVNILSNNESTVTVYGTFEMVRGNITNLSKLFVSGAKNTQFSKADDAQIKMY